MLACALLCSFFEAWHLLAYHGECHEQSTQGSKRVENDRRGAAWFLLSVFSLLNATSSWRIRKEWGALGNDRLGLSKVEDSKSTYKEPFLSREQ